MDKTEWESLITCTYCKNKYDTPIILPCFETICRKDLKILCTKSLDRFYCIFCNDLHQMPDNGFKEDKKMLKLLKLNLEELDLSQLEKHKRAKETCKQLEKDLEEMSLMIAKPVDYLHDYFSSLKNKIDLKREELKQEIDKKYESMIKELNLFQLSCLEGLRSSSSLGLNDESIILRQKLDKWNTLLDKISLDEKNWESIESQAKESNDQVKKKIDFYRGKNFTK